MADSTLTDVGVCNKALVGKLGAESIETITESEITTDLEAICAQAYPTVRDLCLSINDWGFAQKKQQLSEDGATVPVNLHSKAFFLPPDMKHGPDAVYFDGGSIPTTNYEIIGGHMMCDAETVIVEYTIRPDEADWPPYFTSFVIAALAADIAMPVTEMVGKKEDLHAEAWGTPSENMRGGLAGLAMLLDARAKPAGGFLKNGDPLTATRY